MNNNFCFNCGHKIPGLGCTKDGIENNIRVTDHMSCKEWRTLDDPMTESGKEIAHTRRFDADTIEQYRRANMTLNLGA